jgi:hypothetical protein
MKKTLNLPEIDHEKWLNLPRKYKRYATRFELPMDAKEFLSEFKCDLKSLAK